MSMHSHAHLFRSPHVYANHSTFGVHHTFAGSLMSAFAHGLAWSFASHIVGAVFRALGPVIAIALGLFIVIVVVALLRIRRRRA